MGEEQSKEWLKTEIEDRIRINRERVIGKFDKARSLLRAVYNTEDDNRGVTRDDDKYPQYLYSSCSKVNFILFLNSSSLSLLPPSWFTADIAEFSILCAKKY